MLFKKIGCCVQGVGVIDGCGLPRCRSVESGAGIWGTGGCKLDNPLFRTAGLPRGVVLMALLGLQKLVSLPIAARKVVATLIDLAQRFKIGQIMAY